MTDSRNIGRRVAYWRERRNMSRQQFADLVGRSLSWAEKIEAGTRDLVRLPMLRRAADVLQVDMATLVDDAQAEQAAMLPDAAEVAAIKRALGRRYEIVSDHAQTEIDLGQLRRQVGYVNSAWLASDFSVLGRALSDLLDDCQHATETLAGDEQRQAAALLVIAYKIASSTFHKFGWADLAWLAADRAFAAAKDAADPVSLARATRCVARALMAAGQPREAIELTMAVAARLEPGLAEASPELVSLFGMMLLAAQIAAAREGDADLATALHLRHWIQPRAWRRNMKTPTRHSAPPMSPCTGSPRWSG
jgi:transcriptional regulator with XRE-family HTH domain